MMIRFFLLIIKECFNSLLEHIPENSKQHDDGLNEKDSDEISLNFDWFSLEKEIKEHVGSETESRYYRDEQFGNPSIDNCEMEAYPCGLLEIDKIVDTEIELHTANNTIYTSKGNNCLGVSSKDQSTTVDTNKYTEINILVVEKTDGKQKTDGNRPEVGFLWNPPISYSNSSKETKPLQNLEKHEKILEFHESRIPSNQLNNTRPEIDEGEPQINESQRRKRKRKIDSDVSSVNIRSAKEYIQNLLEEIEKVNSGNINENNLSDDLRNMNVSNFSEYILNRILSIQAKNFEKNEDLVCEFKFSKIVAFYEKKYMKNFSIEEKNSMLCEKFGLENFKQKILKLNEYHILSEIPFFMYSYNNNLIHIKEGYVFYVSFMLKLLEVCYSNNERFDRLNDRFCFKYNNNIISFRLIFYNMLSGIKDFDCKKNFYIVISSLIYFNDIGGIKKTRYKKKIYCIQLNILLHSVFLQNSIDKDVNKAIEFCKSTVLNAIESSNSYEKDCFKKFFLHLRDIDLIREYTKIYSLMKNQALCEKVNLVFDEDSENLLIKYSKEGTYANENREYIKDLFTLETLITCLNSKLVYCRYKLRDNFNFCGKKDFWKTLNAELQKSLNQ
ncbi:hypothetical protein LUQ84_003173 [Hamiltosporidium tvaerminnensis]|nr:hypothetical protein LUQ84_003173 [Hamiltosporidium tvaerminnensis]